MYVCLYIAIPFIDYYYYIMIYYHYLFNYQLSFFLSNCELWFIHT